MASNISNWLDERTSWREIWNAIFLRKVPKVNWLFTLGSASLFVAINQAITGILLTIYYVPLQITPKASIISTTGYRWFSSVDFTIGVLA
jgi:quinol-cytochrome oxidoreductase complex cytochrome b subunit